MNDKDKLINKTIKYLLNNIYWPIKPQMIEEKPQKIQEMIK